MANIASDEIETLLTEGLEPVHELLPLMGGPRGPYTRATVVKWIKEGCRGVKLEGCRSPSGWCSTRPALARFLARLTGAVSVAPVVDRKAKTRAAAARAELNKLLGGK